jgi:hypothetical protein
MYKYILSIAACIFLSACGKKGPVESLEKTDFPRTYPKSMDTRVPLIENQQR